MKRSLSTKNLLDKKPGKIVQLKNEALAKAIGQAERKGCWIIYGAEKNGKTKIALALAKDISNSDKVAYVSAEEGTDKSFTDAVNYSNITADYRITWDEYLSIDEIVDKYKRPKTANIIFIDNLTMYSDELKPTELKKKLLDAVPNKLFILLAHEERKEAYPALARMAKKMAKVVIHVKGLKAFVVSRFSKGGEIIIDEEKAALYWGEND